MMITLILKWWHIPAIISFVAAMWTFFWPADTSGMFGGITRWFMAIPALIVSLIAWVIAGFFK